jgi:cohesin complex subunit SA-1/2
MMKNYPLLLRKFMADKAKVPSLVEIIVHMNLGKAKVPSLVEIIVHMNLGLYSLKRQENVSESISFHMQVL